MEYSKFVSPNRIIMGTFLFDKIIFGPVFSRRLGVSLGVNLLPLYRKVCNFNCIYCECGLTDGALTVKDKLPLRKDVKEALYLSLEEMAAHGQEPDVITFAGNGEPTMHPDFPAIIDDAIEVRNTFFPNTDIAVLSNSSTIDNPRIRQALLKVEKNILKLDSAIDSTIMLYNKPRVKLTAESLINNLTLFNGQLIIQTMFIRGTIDNTIIDNTTEEEITEWLKALERIRPAEVQIYTVSRDVPSGNEVHKVPVRDLEIIAKRVMYLGISTQVSG